jgi:hypothetical protein
LSCGESTEGEEGEKEAQRASLVLEAGDVVGDRKEDQANEDGHCECDL